VASSILDVDNIVRTGMFFTVSDDSNSTSVTSADNHDSIPSIKFNRVCDFSCFDINHDCIIDFDVWVRVANSSGIMGDNVWYCILANTNSLDLSEFVSRFFSTDSVTDESSLDVKKKTEEFTCSFNGDDIHKTGRVCSISSDFSIDFDCPLFHNFGNLCVIQSILETVSQKYNEW